MSEYVKCPNCGYRFKDNKIERYSIGALVGTGKIVGHTGLRMLGNTLGMVAGPNGSKIGGRLGGQAAKYIFGNLNDIKFVKKMVCPKCGHKF